MAKIGLPYDIHLLHWDWMIKISMGTFKAAINMYISYKFGGL